MRGKVDQCLELCVFLVWMLMVGVCPWTKVEESFSVQAIHDILVHGRNLSLYDHHEFPGVVPRSFAGPLVVSSLAYLPCLLMEWLGWPKHLLLLGARLALAFLVWLPLCQVSEAVAGRFGRSVSRWFLCLSLAQFHLSFYASRPLPNTFALGLFLLVLAQLLREEFLAAVFTATVSAAILRSELVLLYAPLFLPLFLSRRLSLVDGVAVGILSLVLSLSLTIPLDSYLWGRWLWPEAEVWWFNVVENKSSQWGRMPLLWYFYSALPRGLGASLPLALLSLIAKPQQRRIVLPGLLFVCLYSLLPHKELRFIIYVFPMLNIAAADVLASLWRSGGRVGRLFALGVLALSAAGTSFFLCAAHWNYPGGNALLRLHTLVAPAQLELPARVHIDVYSAQSGVSRFLHLNPAWSYDKTEGLNASSAQLLSAHYLLTGSDTLRSALQPYQRRYREIHTEQSFAGLILPNPLWHFWKLRFRYRNAVAILMPQPQTL